MVELDVRPIPKPEKHPKIFAQFDALAVGEHFVLVNNHEPRHLKDEFEIEHPGGYSWRPIQRGPKEWRIEITKLASTPLPRVLADTAAVTAEADDAGGAAWKLPMQQRDLDSNIIRLGAGGKIDEHAGPDVDVLIHVLHGAGTLTTETGTIDLRPGVLLWLPRRSHRGFTAHDDGLVYLTVHQRRKSLLIQQNA